MAALPNDAPLTAVDRPAPTPALYALGWVPVALANAQALAGCPRYHARGEAELPRDLPTPAALRPYLRRDAPGEYYDTLLSGIIQQYCAMALPLPKAVLARELLDGLPTPGYLTSARAAALVLGIAETIRCGGCGRPLVRMSRRVLHCGDACRRAATWSAEQARAERRRESGGDRPPARIGRPPRPAGPPRSCARPGCDTLLRGRQRAYCSRACAQAGTSARLTALLLAGRAQRMEAQRLAAAQRTRAADAARAARQAARAGRVCEGPGCHSLLSERQQRWCSDRCRHRGQRRRAVDA